MEVLESDIKGELHSINRAKEIVENQVIAENPEELSNRAVETQESNFSFLCISGSANQYSLSYEVLDHESLASEISRQLAIHELPRFGGVPKDVTVTSFATKDDLSCSSSKDAAGRFLLNGLCRKFATISI